MYQVDVKLPVVPDPVEELDGLTDSITVIKRCCAEVRTAVTSVLDQVRSDWHGQAFDNADSILVALRRRMDESDVALGAALTAISAYKQVVIAQTTKVGTLRARYVTHWPYADGHRAKCVNGFGYWDADSLWCPGGHTGLLGSLKDAHKAAFAQIESAVFDCVSVLRQNLPSSQGLLLGGTTGLPPGLPHSVTGPVSRPAYGKWWLRLPDPLIASREITAWVTTANPSEISRTWDSLDTCDKTRLISVLLSTVDPSLFPKVIAAIPDALPNPGTGVVWGLAGGPVLPPAVDSAGAATAWESHDWAGDINQHGYPNCVFSATLRASADADWIGDHIRTNPNGTVTVNLYDPDSGDLVPVTVTPGLPTVDGTTPMGVAATIIGQPNDQLGMGFSWAGYVEKALAQYHSIRTGQAAAYSVMDGRSADTFVPYFTGNHIYTATGPTDLIDKIAAGAVGLAATGGGLDAGAAHGAAGLDLYPAHAYEIESVDAVALTVVVRNTWGKNDPRLSGVVTAAELGRYWSGLEYWYRNGEEP